jgi:hypothetical protein
MPAGTLLLLLLLSVALLLLLLLLLALPSSELAAEVCSAERPAPLLLLVVLLRLLLLPPLPLRFLVLGLNTPDVELLLLLLLAVAAYSSSDKAGSSSLVLRHTEPSGGLLGTTFSTCNQTQRSAAQHVIWCAPSCQSCGPTPPSGAHARRLHCWRTNLPCTCHTLIAWHSLLIAWHSLIVLPVSTQVSSRGQHGH